VVLASCTGISHKNIFETITVIVGYGYRCAQLGIALHDLGIGIVKPPGMMAHVNAGFVSHIFKPAVVGLA
jgi:hypothetical protein